MTRHVFTSSFLLCLLPLSNALGIGADHPPVKPGANSTGRQTGLGALIHRADRVHGFFVNSEDVYFYAGDTPAVNEFLATYSKLENTKLEITLNRGSKKARSPWDKADRNIDVNWKLYTSPIDVSLLMKSKLEQHEIDEIKRQWKEGPSVSKVEIWLGDRISLRDLNVPANIPRRLTDDGTHFPQEVKDFVAKHETLRKNGGNRQ